MTVDVEARLAAGDEAVRAARWQDARAHFEAVLAAGESPEASLGLGVALFWLGDLRGVVDHLERAYPAFRRRPDPLQAAVCALRLALHHRQHLASPAAAAGWLARGARLVEDHDLEPVRGELLLMKAHLAPDPAQGEGWAREALARGRAAGDPDLELCALAQLGATLVEQGRVAEGVALLDEAMAACLGGEASLPDTVVFAHCLTMNACRRCADFERAVQWVRASERAADRVGLALLHAECRAVHARVLLAVGAWRRAEEVARAALELGGEVPAYRADALAIVAELRLAEGRLEEAERLVAGFDAHLPAVPVVARLHLARGRPALAATTIERVLDRVGPGRLEGAELVELLGEAALAQGHADDAAARGRDLAARGAAGGCRIVAGRGHRLLGRALAPADARAARRALDEALAAFVALGMAYEAARTRRALAEALAAHDAELAAGEARAVLAAFEELGAGGDADGTAALLRGLGVKAARSGPRGARDVLTRREEEVLGLLGEGLSNPELAARLHVSRKTVEHHVASVLAKLGLRSRAEAAAEAVRRGAKPPRDR